MIGDKKSRQASDQQGEHERMFSRHFDDQNDARKWSSYSRGKQGRHSHDAKDADMRNIEWVKTLGQ